MLAPLRIPLTLTLTRKIQSLPRNKDSVPPRNLLVRKNEEVVIIDKEGIKIYSKDLQLLKEIKTKIPVVECQGLAEDQEGHLLTVNVNKKGSSSIFIIDVESEQLLNIIDLEPFIDETKQAESSCKFIAFRNGVVYVVGWFYYYYWAFI